MRMWLSLQLTAVLVGITAIATTATADDSTKCSYGDARGYLDSFVHRVDGSVPPCTYRLFMNGQQFSFRAGEHFLGGVVRRLPFTDESSRRSAIEQLEAFQIRVWIAPVTDQGLGPLVEQRVVRTAIKTGLSETGDRFVWAQLGVITQLPAGQYMSITQFPAMTARVRLLITAD